MREFAGASGDVMHLPTVEEFESNRIDPDAFDHESHVYIAWKMLQDTTPVEVIARYTDALKRLTSTLNLDGKYHERISWFFILVIDERMQRAIDTSWTTFRAANNDLISGSKTLLARHYSDERLRSADARRRFLLPDLSRQSHPPHKAADVG